MSRGCEHHVAASGKSSPLDGLWGDQGGPQQQQQRTKAPTQLQTPLADTTCSSRAIAHIRPRESRVATCSGDMKGLLSKSSCRRLFFRCPKWPPLVRRLSTRLTFPVSGTSSAIMRASDLMFSFGAQCDSRAYIYSQDQARAQLALCASPQVIFGPELLRHDYGRSSRYVNDLWIRRGFQRD